MIARKISELKGNEILARAVMTWDYQIILQEGAKLRPEYVEKLEELGILEVMIKEEEPLSHEIVILRSDVESSVKEKVKDVLERHTYQHNDELEKLSKAADNIISNILEEEQVVEKIFDIKQRSSDIYEHSISICSLAILTALKLNIDKEQIHDIGVGCLLHDIGLRYVTVEYSDRSMESYSDKELLDYKKHPVYGYSALQNETWISKTSKDIILNHHERLDGSGFPLKNKDIPIEGRIVNVCDTFDELICGIGCKRYKVHEAVEYLKTFCNIKFDSDVVAAFLEFTAVYPAGTLVLTNEGETGIVLMQNKNFQDRPVIKIVKDKSGNKVTEEIIRDLVKVHHIFIEKVLD